VSLDEDVRLGPSTGCIVDAAVARNIPFSRMTEGSMVRFGWGSKQRRIQAAEMDITSAIAEAIAQDKDLTKNCWPPPVCRCPAGVVSDAEDAWAAACEIGLPVVVKPKDGNQGKGVTVNITPKSILPGPMPRPPNSATTFWSSGICRATISACWWWATGWWPPPGATRPRWWVMACTPCRVGSPGQPGPAPWFGPLHVAHQNPHRRHCATSACRTKGSRPTTIPGKGPTREPAQQRQLVHRRLGHRCDRRRAPRCGRARRGGGAHMVGLDICGVDVVCDSILRPIEEQGGGIVEVNAAPGLRMHLKPSFGKGRAVGEAIISTMFKPGQNGRIPIVAVTGTNGKTTTVRLISHLLGATACAWA
jgi:cyanophycin synthetase